ncbi:MAG: hypothetical protein ACI379_14545 [Nocardioides sp.]|uniref:hypothetical protein n=1 Tax=Nocardioides sp. TaxID=35761 RepID=UPI003F05BD9C
MTSGSSDTYARDFVAAIAARDAAGLVSVLAPGVDFLGLTPRRLWEADDPAGVLDIVLGHWFEPNDRVVGIAEMTESVVADTRRLGYRLDLELPRGPYVVEQQAYYRTDERGIAYLRILCSGFRPATGVVVDPPAPRWPEA